jgi:hypothetical protein
MHDLNVKIEESWGASTSKLSPSSDDTVKQIRK